MKDCPCQLCQLYVAQVPLVEPNTVYFIHSVFVSFYFICFLICFIFLLFVHLFIYLIFWGVGDGEGQLPTLPLVPAPMFRSQYCDTWLFIAWR